MKKIEFTSWHDLTDSPYFDEASFYETFDGGQSFNWKIKEEYVEGIFLNAIFRIKLKRNKLVFSIPKGLDSKTAEKKLSNYVANDIDFKSIQDQLPWRSDPILKCSIEAFPHLRILRQPLNETLFSFLCSSSKQIPQIKQILDLSASRYGVNIFSNYRSLPTWTKLAQLAETELKELKLGFRSKYIYKSAKFINSNPSWLNKLNDLSLNDSKNQLMRLPGVGEKIADCVALFALGKLDAFPIDTWIEKILIKAYELEDFNKNQLIRFAQHHFGRYAGYAQQFLFAAARSKVIKL